jgi:hypothetical protein
MNRETTKKTHRSRYIHEFSTEIVIPHSFEHNFVIFKSHIKFNILKLLFDVPNLFQLF